MGGILGCMSRFHVTDSDGNFAAPRYGIRVACTEFQKNVIKYGGFDCCHFLLGRGGNYGDEDLAKFVAAQGLDPKRILIYDGALPLDRLEGNRYYAIHKYDLILSDILGLRHALGRPLAPATAMNHTLSYATIMPRWMDLLLGHVLPCDAIVCTSKASLQVVENSLGLLSDRLSTQLRARVPPFAGRLEVIPLGVDIEHWKPESNKAEARRLLDLPEHLCLILCPARFLVL